MQFLKGLIVGLILGLFVHIWLYGYDDFSTTWLEKWSQVSEDYFSQDTEQDDDYSLPTSQGLERDSNSDDEAETRDDASQDLLANDHSFEIGMSVDQLKAMLGEPDRIDESAYGYDWYIYNREIDEYIQFGMRENHVTSLYTNSSYWEWMGVQPGMDVSDWQVEWEIDPEPSFRYDLGHYTFSLSEQDVRERPVYIQEDVAIQFYVDIHDEVISGLRVLDFQTLLLHRPYSMRYIGQMEDHDEPIDGQWETIEQAKEKQVFDMVQTTRLQADLSLLEWHEGASVVAKGHSADMLANDFFDHVSPIHGDLGDRMVAGDVQYKGAGENIAWNYADAAEAHHGWLNSLGHRQNVLEPNYTHLGVGVVGKHYTQNFIIK